MDTPATRICKKCLQEKPLDTQHFMRQLSHGRRIFLGSCRDCTNEYRERWRRDKYTSDPAYRARKKTRDARYYASHKADEHFQKVRADYATTHAEQLRAKAKIYRQNHADEAKIRARAWAKAHPARVNERNREWRKAHPKQASAHQKRYWQKHADLKRTLDQLRRAREKQAIIVDHPSLEEIAIRDNLICHICKKKVSRRTWSMDHHFPISLPNAIHGRQYVSLAHGRCNSRRSAGILPVQLRLLP